jgi:trigger factor
MNISREKKDDLNEVIKMQIVADDYNEKVESALKDYKKKARVDGFRPGMVPMGMIKKLYYKPVLAEEINKMVSEKLMEYIKEEKLQILGEPLAHESQKQIDFDKDTEFEFAFEIGLYPEFTSDVSTKDKIAFYEIQVDDKAIEDTLADVSKRYGQLKDAEEISDTGVIKGKIFASGPEGEEMENGIVVDDVSISLDVMKDEEIKNSFKGFKVGERVIFDLKKAYPNDTEISSLLKITKEEATNVEGLFTLEISSIQVFQDHEINQELFDQVYGEGQVNSLEEFKEKIKSELASNFQRESEYRFSIDARKYYLEKTNIDLPIDFLKRWMIETNENITAEQVEKDITEYEEDFKWQIIKNQILKENEIKTSEEEMYEFSKSLTRNQFYGYGLYNIPEDYLEKYASEQLAKPESARKMYEQLMEQKAFRFIQDTVTLEKRAVSLDEFKQLFQK